MSWSRRVIFSLCLAQVGVYAAPRRGFMSGPLVTKSPVDANPAAGAFNLVSDVGVSVVDTLAQSTRFTSNLLTLDLEGALGNLTQLFSKRSVDDLLVQFVQNLPTVLEDDLHKVYKPSGEVAVGQYMTDGTLDAAETAAILNFALGYSKMTPAQSEKIVQELRTAANVMKKGGGDLSSKQLGASLGAAMRSAIEQAPKPLPLIGNPLNQKRQVSIGKAFVHKLVQDQGVAYARGAIDQQLEAARGSGLQMAGLSDDMIRSSINSAVSAIGFKECLEKAKTKEHIVACAKKAEDSKNQIVGSTLETLAPHLKSGKLEITLDSPKVGGPLSLGPRVAEAIYSNQKDVQSLRSTGSPSALAKIVNATAASIARDVGSKVVDEKLAPHFSHSPESQVKVKGHAKTIVDSFSNRLKLIQGGDNLLKQVGDLTQGGLSAAQDNKAIDARLRGPFKETLADSSVKVALLGIMLEKSPLSESLKNDLMKTYRDALRKSVSLNTVDGKLPEDFKNFLRSFDQAVAKVGDVPHSSTTLQHLQDFVNPQSTSVNKIIGAFGPNATGLFSYFVNCKAGQPHCDSVEEPFKSQLRLVRDVQQAMVGTRFEGECKDSALAISQELFKGIDSLDRNIVGAPHDAVLALASQRSQESLNCISAGLAKLKGLPQKNAEALHGVLNSGLAQRPEDRQELIENLHGYLADPSPGSQAQKKLLANTEDFSKNLVSDFARRTIADLGSDASTPKMLRKYIGNTENEKIMHGMVDRLIANTDPIDENTDQSLRDYALSLSKPLSEANTPLDMSVQAGLKKTLQDPQSRRDILKLALKVDDALLNKNGGILGPGLERRLIEAYDKADLSSGDPVFEESTDAGIKKFLSDFDKSVREIDKHRAPGDSALKFYSELVRPQSRVLDKVIADNSNGASALVMSMISCQSSNQGELCSACLGQSGNWILRDPKTGLSEVLAAAPVGHILAFIKNGLKPGPDEAMNRACREAIPKVIQEVVAEPASKAAGPSVMQDPGTFLDAVAKSSNQTAINCIVANFAEAHVLSKLRSQYVGVEAGTRDLLSHLGFAKSSALMELSGPKVFQLLQKRASNTELLKRKTDMMSALKGIMKGDSAESRHGVSLALQNLIRSSVVGFVSDPDTASTLVNGKSVSPALRAWSAQKGGLARQTIACVDAVYSGGLAPVGLYAGEEASRLTGQALSSWIGSARNPAMAPPCPTHSASEACVDGLSIFTAGVSRNPSSSPSTKSPGETIGWVGGYQHTLADMQALNRAESSPTLSAQGEKDVLEWTSNYQKIINHFRTRDLYVTKHSLPNTQMIGEAIYEIKTTVPEAAGVLGNLSSVTKFPVDDILRALERYKESPSGRSSYTLNTLLQRHCTEALKRWSNPSRPGTLNESVKKTHGS